LTDEISFDENFNFASVFSAVTEKPVAALQPCILREAGKRRSGLLSYSGEVVSTSPSSDESLIVYPLFFRPSVR